MRYVAGFTASCGFAVWLGWWLFREGEAYPLRHRGRGDWRVTDEQGDWVGPRYVTHWGAERAARRAGRL